MELPYTAALLLATLPLLRQRTLRLQCRRAYGVWFDFSTCMSGYSPTTVNINCGSHLCFGFILLPCKILSLVNMRFSCLALALLWLWPWASIANRAAIKEAHCAFLPFGRPKASDCVYIVNHVMPEGKDPIGFVLQDYPKYPFMSIPIFWFYSLL